MSEPENIVPITLEEELEEIVVEEAIELQKSTKHTQSDNETTARAEGGWLRRNLFKISTAAFLGGTAVSMAVNPLGGIERDVLHATPWALGGVATTESLWGIGAMLMAGSAGKRIGNPLKLRSRWGEITQSVVDSKMFRTGLAINTLGALGTAAVVEVGTVTSLPPETWLGASGLAAADVASTVALRSGIYASIRDSDQTKMARTEKGEQSKVKVREATLEDIDRLAELDLLLFDKAYGTEKPDKQEVVEMLTERFQNSKGWMFVSEMDGEVEGFVTAFRTNTPIEDFVSWEESTASGTLKDKVDPKGKYVYVANMTIKHEAVVAGAEDMLLANLFANGIKDGVQYGYFVSRMPHFKRWVESQGVNPTELNTPQLAEHYLQLRKDDGKRYDPQLSMYENYGFKLQRMVPNAFEDAASLDYGVIFKAAVPPNNFLKKIKPARWILSGALRQIAKNPKLLKKAF